MKIDFINWIQPSLGKSIQSWKLKSPDLLIVFACDAFVRARMQNNKISGWLARSVDVVHSLREEVDYVVLQNKENIEHCLCCGMNSIELIIQINTKHQTTW
ncbi:CLUMA_CG006137, isoform A [Clunio marinus]|uniref:CLUMA_CG006137, isoform A n=1 Tax=Clunio marinus TaxID=568069 RepID=A0A1J1HYE9_9DIPT|nr:CLUMA_CG006137, isoform A [Clunio marinus]